VEGSKVSEEHGAPMRTETPVEIVGGGLAGLVTAWELTRAGVPCQVFEASPRIGGRVETVVYDDGLTAEAHMEEFWEGSPAYSLIRELGLDLVEEGAHSSLVLGGRLHCYQGEGDRDDYLSGMFDAQERAAWLRWNEHVRLVLDLLRDGGDDVATAPWAAPLMVGRFSSYVHDQVQEPRVEEWIRVVVESETAIEWDRICALDGLTELQPFLDHPAGFGETNAHVAGGNERFIEAILRQLPDGTVQPSRPVTSVRDTGRQVVLRHGRGRQVTASRCEHVVLAVPLWSLPAIRLDAQLEAAAAAATGSWTAGSYVKVLHRLRPEAAALWARHGDGLFTLLTDAAAGCIYVNGDEDSGRDLVLTQLVHAQHARALCGLPHAEIAGRALGALEQMSAPDPLWPGLADLVTDSRVFAYPQAVAYWDAARGRSRFDEQAAALRRPQGRVHFCGDTLESSHSDGAVRSGQRAALDVLGALAGTPGRSLASGVVR
jgi:monoamine oxidase